MMQPYIIRYKLIMTILTSKLEIEIDAALPTQELVEKKYVIPTPIAMT